MIKASELRIGNLVNDFGIICEVNYLIISRLCDIENKSKTCINLSAIPLTEEWLVKFHFENWGIKIVNEYEKYTRWVKHNCIDGTSNFEVHIVESNYGNSQTTEIYYSVDEDRQFIMETDFVYNLQNAYFLISGHELTIK